MTLNDVAVVGDNGTPYSGDDYPICLPDDMLEGATRYCSHTMTIGKSVTIVATATGLDPLGKEVKVQAQATVIVGGRAYLPYIVNRR